MEISFASLIYRITDFFFNVYHSKRCYCVNIYAKTIYKLVSFYDFQYLYTNFIAYIVSFGDFSFRCLKFKG